jgi:pyocin large subunit-like protein
LRTEGAKEKKMTKNNNAGQSNDSAREPNLDSRYGEIGISAVAAALPYRSEVKAPTDESMAQKLDRWIAEMAV